MNVVPLLAGAGATLVVSVVVQLLTAYLARRREHHARLFDAQRQVYAEALREFDQWASSIADNTPNVPVVDEATGEVVDWIHLGAADIGRLKNHPVRSSFELLASREARRALGDLLDALEGAVRESDARRAIPRLQDELRSVMRRDLGVHGM